MGNSNMWYYKCLMYLLVGFATGYASVKGQGNCLIYPEDSGERIACELSYRALEYPQGSHESQILFDTAIKIGPKYAWAYYEKSVPFYKRGMLAEGVSLINKAIALEPKNYLYYRAYWYFHHRSYESCIEDLEALYVDHQASYASTPGGDLEMRLLLAMAHAQSGNLEKGKEWVIDLQNSYEGREHLKGLYDHHILGVIYYENEEYEKSLEEFLSQIGFNPNFADSYYYLGLIHKLQSDDQQAKDYLQNALSRINGEKGGYSLNLFEAYNLHPDLVIAELEKLISSEG